MLIMYRKFYIILFYFIFWCIDITQTLCPITEQLPIRLNLSFKQILLMCDMINFNQWANGGFRWEGFINSVT